MRKPIFFALVLCLNACTMRDSDPFLVSLEAAYARSGQHAVSSVQRDLNLLERAFMSDRRKVERFYAEAQAIHAAAQDFYRVADSLIQPDQPAHPPLESLFAAYANTLDSFRAHLPPRWEAQDTLIAPTYPTAPRRPPEARLTVHMMRTDMAINEANLLRGFLSLISASDRPWDPAKIELIPAEPRGTGRYVVNLNSTFLQSLPDKVIRLDAVTHNGQAVSLSPTIVRKATVAQIAFDSLTAGPYQVKGRVSAITEYGRSFDFPFEHAFNIEAP